jgi:outer membrane receptor protein involved in Fe transport
MDRLYSNTRTFRPNLVNEARFGYSQFYNSIGTRLAFEPDVVSEIGIPGQKSGAPVTWGIPNIGFSGTGFAGIGDSNEGPYENNNKTLQLVDKLSWIRGNHTLRFGLEYNRQNYNQVGNQFSRGLFTFQANTTRSATNAGGHAFAKFLLGNLFVSTNAVAIADAKFQRNAYHAFIDDTWKLTPKLTLALGLRYELTPPFTNTRGDYFTVAIPKVAFVTGLPESDWPYFVRQGRNCTDPYQGLNIRWTNTKAVCGGGLNNNLLETKYKNFAPRLGIAYTLDNKTAIRTGFGVFYNQDIQSDPGTPTLHWSNAIPGGNGAIAQVPPPYAYVASYDYAPARGCGPRRFSRRFDYRWLAPR